MQGTGGKRESVCDLRPGRSSLWAGSSKRSRGSADAQWSRRLRGDEHLRRPEGRNRSKGLATTYRFEFGAEDCATSTCIVVGQGSVPSGSAKVKEASVEGLSPLTLYHFRVVVKHSGEGELSSGDRIFATRSADSSGPARRPGLRAGLVRPTRTAAT